jgi:hypothetical protein
VRTIIVGGPKTGKTTLSNVMPGPVRHTDDYAGLGWSLASEEVSRLFRAAGPWTVEGVATARALRKWLRQNADAIDAKPCDRIISLTKVRDTANYTTGHLTMAKGIATVFAEIKDELIRRGVRVEVQEC